LLCSLHLLDRKLPLRHSSYFFAWGRSKFSSTLLKSYQISVRF
jgi:hypothetical protein